jgi:hypothetical protein
VTAMIGHIWTGISLSSFVFCDSVLRYVRCHCLSISCSQIDHRFGSHEFKPALAFAEIKTDPFSSGPISKSTTIPTTS